MKIQYSHHIFSSQTVGGISNYFVDLAESMTDRKNFVELGFPLTLTRSLRASLVYNGTVVPDRLIRRGISWRIIDSMNSASEFFRNQRHSNQAPPDVFHRTYYSTSGNFSSAPEVITVYDMIHEDFPEFFRTPIFETKLKSIRRASAVICISEYTRRRLLALTDVDPAKVVAIPLGIRRSNFPPNKTRQASGRPYILYVGNRGGYKNFEVLEKAFSELIKSHTDLILCLVGGGPLNKSELSRFGFLGIKANVRVANQSEELDELINLAQCVVSTSLVEGFGLVPLEALNHQTPCVITDIEVNREIWNETLPIFSPKDYLHLAAQIKHLLESDEHWYNVSKNGFAVAQSLNIERMVESTIDIYKNVAKGL